MIRTTVHKFQSCSLWFVVTGEEHCVKKSAEKSNIMLYVWFNAKIFVSGCGAPDFVFLNPYPQTCFKTYKYIYIGLIFNGMFWNLPLKCMFYSYSCMNYDVITQQCRLSCQTLRWRQKMWLVVLHSHVIDDATQLPSLVIPQWKPPVELC